MTEYSVEKFYDEYAIKQEDKIIAVLDSGTNARKVCDLLNMQEEEIKRLKWSNKILRANKKDCEFGRKKERKRWENMDKMRIEHIQLL